MGKTHLSIALAHAAVMAGHSVLFASAVDIVNTLTTAQAEHRLKSELRKFLAPRVLVVDEVGYLPIDKIGADVLFQVISQRYEQGSLILTTNQPYKSWPKIFNNDATLTSAVLDRLLHHAGPRLARRRDRGHRRQELPDEGSNRERGVTASQTFQPRTATRKLAPSF